MRRVPQRSSCVLNARWRQPRSWFGTKRPQVEVEGLLPVPRPCQQHTRSNDGLSRPPMDLRPSTLDTHTIGGRRFASRTFWFDPVAGDVLSSFCTALKPPAAPAAGLAVGRACGLRPVAPSAAPHEEATAAQGGEHMTGLACFRESSRFHRRRSRTRGLHWQRGLRQTER